MKQNGQLLCKSVPAIHTFHFYSMSLPCFFVFLKMWRPVPTSLVRHMRYIGSGSKSSTDGPLIDIRIKRSRFSMLRLHLSRVFIRFCVENPRSHSTELTGKTLLNARSFVMLGYSLNICSDESISSAREDIVTGSSSVDPAFWLVFCIIFRLPKPVIVCQCRVASPTFWPYFYRFRLSKPDFVFDRVAKPVIWLFEHR